MNNDGFMMKYIFILLFSVNVFILNAQRTIYPSLVKWYTLEEAVKLAESNPRPIMLDVYTDWCSWCKFMMTTTFANKALAEYINNNFYAAKFNAESFDSVVFQGKKYFNRRIGNRPSHDLAAILLDGKLSYPSLVFFDREGNRSVIPGYKEAKDLEPILIYFAENINKNASLNDFYIDFMYSFPKAYNEDHSIFKIDQKLKPDTLGNINWIEPGQLERNFRKNPKPVILFFYTGWSIGSKVMEKTTFRNREIANKINSTNYFVKIDAASNDTIHFMGKMYHGTGENLPNQMAYAFLNNNFMMPAIVFLDEKMNISGMINGYWHKSYFMPLFEYFHSNSHKKMTFQEYMKSPRS